MFSLSTLARHSEGRRQALSVLASLIVHAGFAAYLMQAPPSSLTASRGSTGDDATAGAVTVQLVRAGFAHEQAASRPTTVEQSPTVAPAAIERGEDGSEQTHAPSPAREASDGAGAAASLQQAGNANVGSDYQRRLLAHIQPFKRYPDQANRAGVRGVVQLIFELDRQGHVLGVWVARSSGSAILDAAAVDTVRRAAPLPPIPAALPGDLTIQLPVEFEGPSSSSEVVATEGRNTLR